MKEKLLGCLNTLAKNSFFYRLYYLFYRSRKGDPIRLPRRSDEFFFDGYPRSGNTYVINLMRHVLDIDRTKYTSHLHAVAGLKIALRKKLRPVVIIRHPKDSIASYYFTRSSPEDPLNMQLLRRLIHQYTSYYQYVYERRTSIKTIQFEYVVEHEQEFIKDISQWLGYPPLEGKVLETRIKSYKAFMKEKEREKDIRISALPNQSRSQHTSTTKKQLAETPDFQKALEIYLKTTAELPTVSPDVQ